MKIVPLYPPLIKRIDVQLLLVWVFAILSLSFSFAQEFLWNLKPCFLCQLQRIPFFPLSFLPLIAIFFSKNFLRKSAIACLTLSWLFATFHFFVQMRLVQDTCLIPDVQTIEDFKKILENQTSCAKIDWAFLGLPISAYNAIISVALCYFLILKRNYLLREN